ncbi:relaxase/mobilization nuclease domain-containing protein [Cytophagaceae bacterium DM2B3-1]|uniref:Relaxase/mobilization nuclease domain-containing protein n=1 Tax=Xanthocytophaga flava TaxID=3048013 RepID=A0ABT7CJ30_9BACT|nr:relaxase/mobilization nuclease domain-containing protein [Xanthocytophaga flavus]MDJ1493723.1 relaxase/mobilization nuclease domain-containing protein [Xanthocytophaga flavus]
MVAIIKTSASIYRIVNYNENKVKQGVAHCIAAINYPKEADELSISQKLNRLLNQAALNENVTRNSVHISLNFDPSEKLSGEQLQEIAQTYMDKIGFGNQPYLVYEHCDAAHPHIHIVSIKVRSDGSRIDMQNIGRNQSEKARKEIEKTFRLVQASGNKQKSENKTLPVNVQKVQYGKIETKKAISTVLDFVLNNYCIFC